MKKTVDNEIFGICNIIKEENLSFEELLETESCDRFQTEHYCGGFDSIEEEFCFSYYDDDRNEYYLQLSVDDVYKIVDGTLTSIDLDQVS